MAVISKKKKTPEEFTEEELERRRRRLLQNDVNNNMNIRSQVWDSTIGASYPNLKGQYFKYRDAEGNLVGVSKEKQDFKKGNLNQGIQSNVSTNVKKSKSKKNNEEKTKIEENRKKDDFYIMRKSPIDMDYNDTIKKLRKMFWELRKQLRIQQLKEESEVEI